MGVGGGRRQPNKELDCIQCKVEEKLCASAKKLSSNNLGRPRDEISVYLSGNASATSEGLSKVPQGTLERFVQPLLHNLAEIDAASLLNLHTSDLSTAVPIGGGVKVHPIHQSILPKCENINVRYLHLAETSGQYSMGIFVFPPNAKIPLHDHPGMCVLSRVLYGKLRRYSLDLERNQAPPPTRRSWLPWSQSHSTLPAGAKQAYVNAEDVLEAPSTTALYPYEGNLHEFVAGPQGAAVLDLLLPPYDSNHDRDCEFFDIVTDPQAFSDDIAGRRPCWIVPTDQPEDFHCITGSYNGLGYP